MCLQHTEIAFLINPLGVVIALLTYFLLIPFRRHLSWNQVIVIMPWKHEGDMVLDWTSCVLFYFHIHIHLLMLACIAITWNKNSHWSFLSMSNIIDHFNTHTFPAMYETNFHQLNSLFFSLWDLKDCNFVFFSKFFFFFFEKF